MYGLTVVIKRAQLQLGLQAAWLSLAIISTVMSIDFIIPNLEHCAINLSTLIAGKCNASTDIKIMSHTPSNLLKQS